MNKILDLREQARGVESVAESVTEPVVESVAEPVTDPVTDPVTELDHPCSLCALREHLTTLINNQYFDGISRQLSYRDMKESGEILSLLFNDKSIGLIGQWGSTCWGAVAHMFYRHNDGKCYGFYTRDSDMPSWVFPIDQDFVNNYLQ